MTIHRVGSWMSKPAITVKPTATLAEAHRLMQQHRIRRLPVIVDGQLIGIITRGDLRAAQPKDSAQLDFGQWRALLEQATVQESMSHNPVTATPGELMIDIAHRLLTHKISGLPVVDNGQVVGVISESDLLYLLIADEVRLEELVAGGPESPG